MNNYEFSAQKAWEAILGKVKELEASGVKRAEISRMLGHKGRSAVTSWLNESSTAANASFSDMLKYLDALNLNILDFLPVSDKPAIKRAAAYAQAEIIESEDLRKVPVIGDAGAGPEVEIFDVPPESFLYIPPNYYRPDMVAIKIIGNSMEPTIKNGAYVGVVRFNGELREGAIYLVSLPPFGRVVKRVRMGGNGEIILVSDNPAYGERVVPYEGYDHLIAGHILWIWQKCWDF